MTDQMISQPHTPNEPDFRLFNIRISPEQKRRLLLLADWTHRDMSGYLRHIIDRDFEAEAQKRGVAIR